MLARLAAIPGVSEARTDSSGRFFWIVPAAGADPDRVRELALAALGKGASVLPPGRAGAQLAARAHGDPWLSAAEVMTLSFVEGRLLSVRVAGEAARRTGATAPQREELAEAIRAELFGAMERVHAEGGRPSSGWIYVEWPALAAAAVARCDPALPPELRARLAEALPGLLAG